MYNFSMQVVICVQYYVTDLFHCPVKAHKHINVLHKLKVLNIISVIYSGEYSHFSFWWAHSGRRQFMLTCGLWTWSATYWCLIRIAGGTGLYGLMIEKYFRSQNKIIGHGFFWFQVIFWKMFRVRSGKDLLNIKLHLLTMLITPSYCQLTAWRYRNLFTNFPFPH